jgi:cobaltochelatase CobT
LSSATPPPSPTLAAAARALGDDAALAPDALVLLHPGHTDADALKRRFYAPVASAMGHPLYPALEKARALSLGGQYYQGAAGNMQAWLAGALTQVDDPAQGRPLALQSLLLSLATGTTPSPATFRFCPPQAYPQLEGLLPYLNNPIAFAQHAQSVLESLSRSETDMGDSADETAQTATPLSEGMEEDATEGDEAAGAAAEAGEEGERDRRDDAEEQGDLTPGEHDASTSPSLGEGLPDSSLPPPALAPPNLTTNLASYHVYTRAFDRVEMAAGLATPDELHHLRRQLDTSLQDSRRLVQKLANRLQRQLLAQQQRYWRFDQEEGILDNRRLARLIARPNTRAVFKHESESRFPETVVSLLVDNSGSMRGKPMLMAALAADILARTLERCQLAVEILGFTTASWKGGRARTEWLSAGRPPHPGRLNELRHIVYKSAFQPYRRAHLGLALMLKEGLLKENIDGEAIEWAYARLLSLPQPRKILLVISDGAPVDDATLSCNNAEYLEQHLRHVIARIEQERRIELRAIGIGHDVTRYYQHAVTLKDSTTVGDTLFKVLSAALR